MSKAGKRLIGAAREMLAIARGEAKPARVQHVLRVDPQARKAVHRLAPAKSEALNFAASHETD